MKAQGETKSSQNNGKKKDLNKIKCFHCYEYEHYETNSLHKKSIKKHATGAGGDFMVSHFQLYFTLFTCMANIVRGVSGT